MVEKATVSANHHRTPSPPSTQFYKPAPAEINYGNLRFLITDRPTDFTISQFIDELTKHQAYDVVRVCQSSYKTEPLEQQKITVYDWEFPDGSPPPDDVCQKWFSLVSDRLRANPGNCIAIHCVAGLGRAPVLVALALMEAGMAYEDAVETIRKHRRGALNQKQLEFLETYKPKGTLKKVRGLKRNSAASPNKDDKPCCVM